MRVTLESTTRIITVSTVGGGSIQARVWEGISEAGVKVQALIPRIAAEQGQDLSQFEAELKEQRAPSAEVAAFPLRMIL